MATLKVITEERVQTFWAKFKKVESGCWEWQYSKSRTGYGSVRFDKKTFEAHRVAYLFANGSIPDGLHVCHKCDNPACGNPDHLFLGTHQDNMLDMRMKGRSRKPFKTHCYRGHPYDEANTGYPPSGRRYCKKCRLITQRELRAKK